MAERDDQKSHGGPSGTSDTAGLDAPVHCILIVSTGLAPKTGGIQRTQTFFRALQKIGPTSLVAISYIPETTLREHFPDAVNIHRLSNSHVAPPKYGRLKRTVRAFNRLVFPNLDNRVDLMLRKELLNRIAQRDDERLLLVFRYVRPFLISGIEHNLAHNISVCVDVDDRDDHKFQNKLEYAVGRGVTRRLMARILTRRLLSVVRKGLKRTAHVWFAAEEDVFDLGTVPTSVIQNVSWQSPKAPMPSPSSVGQSLLFVGGYGHDPNRLGVIWFLRNCWPRIRAEYPNAVLRIVGRGDWVQLRSMPIDIEQVEFVGEVDDVDPEYARSRAVICPIHIQAGSAVKLIEACAYGRPIVTTETAARGFGSDVRGSLLVSDDAMEFSAHCLKVLSDSAECDRLGADLKRIRDQSFSPETMTERIAHDLRTVLGRMTPPLVNTQENRLGG